MAIGRSSPDNRFAPIANQVPRAVVPGSVPSRSRPSTPSLDSAIAPGEIIIDLDVAAPGPAGLIPGWLGRVCSTGRHRALRRRRPRPRLLPGDQFVAAGVVIDRGESGVMVAIPVDAAPAMATALLADTVTLALTRPSDRRRHRRRPSPITSCEDKNRLPIHVLTKILEKEHPRGIPATGNQLASLTALVAEVGGPCWGSGVTGGVVRGRGGRASGALPHTPPVETGTSEGRGTGGSYDYRHPLTIANFFWRGHEHDHALVLSMATDREARQEESHETDSHVRR